MFVSVCLMKFGELPPGVYACYFSISQLRGDGAYLLSIAALPSPLSKEISNQFVLTGRRTAWLADL